MVLRKRTSNDPITPAKKIRIEEETIEPCPEDPTRASRVREKLEGLGIDEECIPKALKWARRRLA
jgi:hypothetical protein